MTSRNWSVSNVLRNFSLKSFCTGKLSLMALLCTVLLAPFAVFAQTSFVVRDMRVEGLQRISEGTVFNYMPINIGDTIDQVRVQEAIRSLYTQALFDDIEVVVHVVNRRSRVWLGNDLIHVAAARLLPIEQKGVAGIKRSILLAVHLNADLTIPIVELQGSRVQAGYRHTCPAKGSIGEPV